MTCCLNPDCQHPQNADDAEFCLSCGTKLIPSLRGRYRVIRPIGQGGFGRTYLAEDDDRLKARCVIKQFSPQLQGTKSLEKAVKLFEQEAVRLYELGEHPQIPALLAYFAHDKRLYLVQQFVEGNTLLQELAQNGVFIEQRIREVLAGILPILKFVHDHQVIHRDITPSNIIRRKFDNKLVLIDFGVAKLLSVEASNQPGTKIGTEGYAPIEQLRSGRAYPASDIYSLGATCLFLMTQVKPEDLYDPLQGRWLWRERLNEKGRTISEPIAQILDKMLKDLVSERYQSADAVMKDLRTALSRPPIGATVSRSRQPAGQPPIAASLSGSAIASQPVSQSQMGQPRVSGTPPSRPPISKPSVSKPPLSSAQKCHCLHTLVGHSRWVTAVAISPNAETIASGGLDDNIKIWNRATGELLRTLTGHNKPINCLSISPNGQILVSGSDDDTIRLWHLADGRLLQSLTGHTRDVNSVVISANGQLLASGSEDRTVRLWKLTTGEALRSFSGLAGMVRSVALSPDGQFLVSGGLDNQIKLWSLKTNAPVRTLPNGHFNSVNGVVITPDGKTLVSASKDKTIKVWDLAKGVVVRTLSGHMDSVNAIDISRDGKLLVSGSSDTTIKLWNLEIGTLIGTLTEHISAVNAVALSGDSSVLVSGSSDSKVKVWQLG
ncbi:MAG: serine/threonine protein kinase [Stenomitos rutilans HA7619-LM2]|jgi:WD40 repeat protein/tRNA A-37 threonylcarbamoyl transferase component Bud32|nr:serine/threonine protein kinase [Stenomitos rutilans HA7619-LM2]